MYLYNARAREKERNGFYMPTKKKVKHRNIAKESS